MNSLDYAVVIEGDFKLLLDSGEERILPRGHVTIQRSTNHRWINITRNELLPGHMLFDLLDVNEVEVGGVKVPKDLGALERDHVDLPGHE